MAKVMVSLPDDLLRTLDMEAEQRGTTRSGLLREFAEQSLRQRSLRRSERMAQLEHGGTNHGGRVAELVKAHRPAP